MSPDSGAAANPGLYDYVDLSYLIGLHHGAEAAKSKTPRPGEPAQADIKNYWALLVSREFSWEKNPLVHLGWFPAPGWYVVHVSDNTQSMAEIPLARGGIFIPVPTIVAGPFHDRESAWALIPSSRSRATVQEWPGTDLLVDSYREGFWSGAFRVIEHALEQTRTNRTR